MRTTAHQAARTRRRLRVAGALTASAALAASGVLLAGPAHAALADITCAVGSATTGFSPALTDTPKDTAVDTSENYDCTSLLTAVSSASATLQAVIPQDNCILALQPPFTSQTVVYRWNTGQSSTVTFLSATVATAADGTVTVTKLGSVTAGLGIGEVATRVAIAPALSLTACATTGISRQTSISSLIIAPV